MKIAIDTEGGDYAPEEIIRGCLDFVPVGGSTLLLVGSRDRTDVEIESFGDSASLVKIEFVTVDPERSREIPARIPPTLWETVRLTAEGFSDWAVTFNDTGSAILAGVRIFGRIPGIHRPAIPVTIPAPGGQVILIDAGANPICGPDDLLSFARLGAAYFMALGTGQSPRVGLLNIGAEGRKGNASIRTARNLFEIDGGFNFVGNVEAHEMFESKADILVCDGFVGNILLKGLEGFASAFVGGERDDDRLNPDTYGAAPLLGISGNILIGHGRSKAPAVRNSLFLAQRLYEKQLTRRIKDYFLELASR